MDDKEPMFEQWDPYDLLQKLAHDIAMLNGRQLELERFFQQLANQNAALAEHIAQQQREITEVYLELGRILSNEAQ